MGKQDAKKILSADTNQPFIIELLVGISLIATPIVMMFYQGFADPALISALTAGILVIVFSVFNYRKQQAQKTQMVDEGFRDELDSRINETFIIQMIFGIAMVVAPLIMMITSGFDLNLIMTIVSGGLLVVYSLIYYRMMQNLMKTDEKDFEDEARAKINQTFIIQMIFGIAMVVAPLIMMFTYGFDLNLIMTIVSGGLLVAYSIYYYRVLQQLKK